MHQSEERHFQFKLGRGSLFKVADRFENDDSHQEHGGQILQDRKHNLADTVFV